MNRDIRIEFNEYETELKELFGDTSVELIDILDACTNLIIENKKLVEENEELERRLEEDYQPKDVDYYEEYGLSEDDFH